MHFEAIITGTGIPLADGERAGAGVLVQRGDLRLQFDAGRGTVMRLAAVGVRPNMLTAVFITHHHSDHVLSLDDLALTRWIEWSDDPLPVIAPEGPATRFARRCLEPWDDDSDARAHHMSRETRPGIEVSGFEAPRDPAVVWEGEGVSVSAMAVRHQPLEPAVAYRIDAPEGSLVISGDTRVCEEVERLATGADVLVHEVALTKILPGSPWAPLLEYHADSVELGAMAARAGVSTLVFTHYVPPPRVPEDLERFVSDVREGGFTGDVVTASDLESITIG